MTNSVDISVVIPAHDEEGNVAPLCAEIRAALDPLGRSYEILFIDDGSRDGTASQLENLRRADARVRLVQLDGNFGEAAALTVGFHLARAPILVTIDGDGQNDPADIPRLVEALERAGLKAVSGRRLDRKESYWWRVVPSRLANGLIARLTGVPVHDCGCGLKAYRRDRLALPQLPRGMHRYLPALLGLEPHEVAEVVVRDRKRGSGTSHYGISRALVVTRDLLALPFLRRNPQRAEVVFGLGTAAAAATGGLVLSTSSTATAVFDAIAIVVGLVWWNARRFNRAQEQGVYRLRLDDPAL